MALSEIDHEGKGMFYRAFDLELDRRSAINAISLDGSATKAPVIGQRD
jgi:hypothetical protein